MCIEKNESLPNFCRSALIYLLRLPTEPSLGSVSPGPEMFTALLYWEISYKNDVEGSLFRHTFEGVGPSWVPEWAIDKAVDLHMRSVAPCN